MTSMDIGESAELLKVLARPVPADCPDVELQKFLITELENAIKKVPDNKLDKDVLFVGAFELPAIPAASEEVALFNNVKLINLPAKAEVTASPGSPAHSLHPTRNGFSLVEAATIAPELVRYTMLTMIRAHQLEYLRKSGIVGTEWKILVEIHYYRNRGEGSVDRFHKDTFGETLFVNLNYDTEVDIPGPEYILNPRVVEQHEVQIENSLPRKFLDDLKWIRGQLGEPKEISVATIKPNQFIGFVDEAIHHRSPHYGGRTVKGAGLGRFLTKEFGESLVKDAQAASKAFREGKSAKPFSSYLKVISADNADRWFNWIGLVERDRYDFNRLDLINAGMSTELIDKLFAEYPLWAGFQNVSIPGAKEVPVAEAPLKRQMSEDALNKTLPPESKGNRSFFRTWVRAVPVR